jgi:SAM-dependent methyltransferase
MADGAYSIPLERALLGRTGFATGSATYERARPTYPADAVAHLEGTTGIGPGSRVLDLAAGTGKFTRQLNAGGVTCVAVEPSAAMREVFVTMVPGTGVIGGTAEAIPLATGSMDAVVVAQAFHWFEPSRALPEVIRVLGPEGWLALIWNERDESDPVMAELVRISKWDQCQPYPMGTDFGQIIDRSELFGPVHRTKFAFVQEVDLTVFVDQVASRSYVQVLPDEERQALLDKVAAFGSTLGEPIAIPYITDLFYAQVRPS